MQCTSVDYYNHRLHYNKTTKSISITTCACVMLAYDFNFDLNYD